jgi:hypothetical protein
MCRACAAGHRIAWAAVEQLARIRFSLLWCRLNGNITATDEISEVVAKLSAMDLHVAL